MSDLPPGFVLEKKDDDLPEGFVLEEPSFLEKARGVGETVGMFASSIAAQPVAGLAGLAAAPIVGGERAGQIVRDAQDALTFQPRSPLGKQYAQSAGEAIAPVARVMEAPGRFLGDKTLEATDSPALAAAAYTLPEAVLALAGVKKPKFTPNTAGQDLVAAGENAGIGMMTSDVLPPTTRMGKYAQQKVEEIPLVGTGPGRAAQQAQRQAAVEQYAQQFGQFSYEDIVNNLVSQRDKVKRAAGSVLQGTGGKLDSIGPVPLNHTQKAIADAIAEMNRPGVVSASSKAADDLAVVQQALGSPQSFTMLKSNRTTYRELKDGIDPVTGSQMPSYTKKLAEDVYTAMSRDMDEFASANLSPKEYTQWKRANAVYASEAQKMTRTRLKRVLDTGDMTPENVQTMLFSKKPSEVKTIYDSLSARGKANGRAAIISKIVDNISARKDGFTPNAFLNELSKYKASTDTFFQGSQKTQLEGLRRALDATRRAQEAAAAPPTGQSLWPYLVGGAAVIDPTLTAGVLGTTAGLARLYESPAVRDSLLRLGAGPASGPTFDLRLAKTRAAVVAALASQRDVETTAQTQQ